MLPYCVCAVILCFREVVVCIQYIFGRDYTIHVSSILVCNVAFACVLVAVVFDEQLSEFGALVVDGNGKASIVAGADEIVDYVPEFFSSCLHC